MSAEPNEYAAKVAEAEAAVKAVKDTDLRRAAFEKVLEHLLGSTSGHPFRGAKETSPKSRAHAGKSTAAQKANSGPNDTGATKGARRRAQDGSRARGRPGPKAAIGQLLESGYLRSARTISQIQEELQHRRGHRYAVQELSPALVRSVRDGSLTRERNESGQYEYRQA